MAWIWGWCVIVPIKLEQFLENRWICSTTRLSLRNHFLPLSVAVQHESPQPWQWDGRCPEQYECHWKCQTTYVFLMWHITSQEITWLYRENICARQAGASGTNDNLIVTGRLQKLTSILRCTPDPRITRLILQVSGTNITGNDVTLDSFWSFFI
jgi:hypothetical protein